MQSGRTPAGWHAHYPGAGGAFKGAPRIPAHREERRIFAGWPVMAGKSDAPLDAAAAARFTER
jgi:hypothetical protein